MCLVEYFPGHRLSLSVQTFFFQNLASDLPSQLTFVEVDLFSNPAAILKLSYTCLHEDGNLGSVSGQSQEIYV
jgi:hypothetical protein